MSDRVNVRSIESLPELAGRFRAFAGRAVAASAGLRQRAHTILEQLESVRGRLRGELQSLHHELSACEASQSTDEDGRSTGPDCSPIVRRIAHVEEELRALEADLGRLRERFDAFGRRHRELEKLASDDTARATGFLDRSYGRLVTLGSIRGDGGEGGGSGAGATGSGEGGGAGGEGGGAGATGPRIGGQPGTERQHAGPGKCTTSGDPVDVATGAVLVSAVDVALPGPLPLLFERHWFSTSTYDGELGHGWHHSLDLAMARFGEGRAVVRLWDGRYAELPAPAGGQRSYLRMERIGLTDVGDEWVLDVPGGVRFHFSSPRPADPAADEPVAWSPLERVEDRNGNAIRLEREGGVVVRIHDSAGRVLAAERDGRGRIVRVVGPAADGVGTMPLVVYEYDEAGDLVLVRDAGGAEQRYAYSNHLLARWTDASGTTFHYEYEGAGFEARCRRAWGDGGLWTRAFAYDLDQRRTTETDGRGARTVYEWVPPGVVTSTIDALGNVWGTEWNEHGERTAVTDPTGARTEFHYDDAGRLVRTVDPLGHERRVEYDARGNAVRLIDELGHEWRRRYDDRGNVIEVEDPLGAVHAFAPDARGLPVRLVDPLGHASAMHWDAAGNLRETIDPLGAGTRLDYDAHGRPSRRVDAMGGETVVRRDAGGRPVEMRDAEGRVTRLRRDAAGNVVSVTDPLGRERRFGYGPLNRLERVQEPSGAVTRWSYDPENDLESVRDDLGRRWRFTRDVLGRVVEERDFTGRRLRYQYDAAGRMAAMINGRGQRTDFERDACGRLVRRRFEDGGEETFAYDAAGRLVRAENADALVEFRYDPVGRCVAEAIDGAWVESKYDARGIRIERVSPSGRVVRFEHDPAGRLARLSDSNGPLLDFEHDALGREVRRRMRSGAVSERAYLRTGELLRQQTTSASGEELLARTYRYDAAAQLREVLDATFGLTRYEHDLDGRLAAAIRSEGVVQPYEVDSAGNVPAAPIDGVQGPTAVLEQRLDGCTAWYDADRNLVARSTGKLHSSLSYDALGQLREFESKGDTTTYKYDALGRRVGKSGDWGKLRYQWDGDVVLADGAVGTYEATERIQAAGSVAPLVESVGSEPVWLESDQAGAIIGAIDAKGCLAWHTNLDPFGNLQDLVGTPTSTARLPGQQLDRESGLCYNRFRYYAPEFRSYTSPDPIGLSGGLQTHSYVRDPTSWIDPLGLSGGCRARTAPGTAFFWSGRSNGTGVQPTARRIAAERGGTTLEMLIENRGIEMPMYDSRIPTSQEAWSSLSKEYAAGASGEVRVVLGDLRPGNIWEAIELPELRKNPDVTRIVAIDAGTLHETVLFSRTP